MITIAKIGRLVVASVGAATLALTVADPGQAADRLPWQPGPVTAASCALSGAGQFTASWQAPQIQGATPVRLYQYAISSTGGQTYGPWRVTQAKSVTFPFAKLGMAYTVMVVAQNDAGISAGTVVRCPVLNLQAPVGLALPQG